MRLSPHLARPLVAALLALAACRAPDDRATNSQGVVDLQEGYKPVGFGSVGNSLGAELVELRLSS